MTKKLLDQARDRLRAMHYSYRTEETYVDWMRRFILFHQKRHPAQMGAPEIQSFLTRLGTACRRIYTEPGPQRYPVPLPGSAP